MSPDFVLDVPDAPRDALEAFRLSHKEYEQAVSVKRKATQDCKDKKRALMLSLRALKKHADDIGDDLYLLIIREAEVSQSHAYNYIHALQFIERTGRLDEQDAGLPELSAMSAAESVFIGEKAKALAPLGAKLVKQARESGTLPSKAAIERAIRGDGPLQIKLDCRGRGQDPELGEDEQGRLVLEGVRYTLQRLIEAGSENAQAQLDDIEKRVREAGKAIDVALKRGAVAREVGSVTIQLDISARIKFKPDLTGEQKGRLDRNVLEAAEVRRKTGDARANRAYLNLDMINARK